VILEFETTGFAVQSGSPFRMRYIAVITIGDDGIVTYRDYWSPMAAAEALDAPDLRDASLSTRS
jgi:ketosteroid isomerase-like protein